MSSKAPPLTTPFPPDVVEFAAERGLTESLAAVRSLTEDVFPGAPLTVTLQSDPEIAEERGVVFEVDVAGLDEEQLFTGQRKWTAGLFGRCPAAHVHAFRLGMWASA
jgi:hypothetical protein